jgi:ketosteroid isomerase-like protein
MSEENVELVRRGWEAAFLPDEPDWETLDALIDPRHELVTLVGLVEGAHDAQGVEGFRQFRERMNQTGEWAWDVDRMVPAPGDRVVALGTFRMRAFQSGVELAAERGIVQTLAAGRIVRTEVFPTPQEALEAAGVTE